MKLFNQTNYSAIMKSRDINNTIMALVTHAALDRAMANKSYEETELHSAFVVNGSSLGFTFGDDDRPERCYKAFFAATSAFLSKQKIANEQDAVALVLTDVTGNFKFAAWITYTANETDENEPGNWNYAMSFNEADLNELESERQVKKFLYGDTAFQSVYDTVAYDVAGISFPQDRFMYDSCLLVVDTLVQVLDGEAIPGETVEIEMPGYFTASVEVENDTKIFGITPAGQMKQVAKGDAELEKE